MSNSPKSNCMTIIPKTLFYIFSLIFLPLFSSLLTRIENVRMNNGAKEFKTKTLKKKKKIDEKQQNVIEL